MASKKKKMTPAQAAAARRPDDWESPQNQNAKKPKGAKKPTGDIVRKGFQQQTSGNSKWKVAIPFLLLIVALSIIAPFIVIYVSNFLGIGA